MNVRALMVAAAIGLALQLAMVIAGHYEPFIKDNVFAIGGVLISLMAGFVYARRAGGGWVDSLLGGLIAGGVCALLGIAVSVLLQDVPASILMFGTIGSAVTGLIGGAIGKALRRA
jgi:hypothetical protein